MFLCNNDCLEDTTEDCQNCCVPCHVLQLCQWYMHTYEQFMQMTAGLSLISLCFSVFCMFFLTKASLFALGLAFLCFCFVECFSLVEYN